MAQQNLKKAQDEVAGTEGNSLSTAYLEHPSSYLFILLFDLNVNFAEKMRLALEKKDLDLAAAQKEAKEKTTLADKKLASVGALEEDNAKLKASLTEANKEATHLKKDKFAFNEKTEGISRQKVVPYARRYFHLLDCLAVVDSSSIRRLIISLCL